MTTPCTRCETTGFLNIHQVADGWYDEWGIDGVKNWIAAQTEPHDVQVCDCCGDGEGWYGIPGRHYGPEDPQGDNGPYAYNGGLCECH